MPRQADIKIEISDGRKIVVLCDGEAFHGPKAIFGDPVARVAADRETALAYFDLGYSIVRYSESEVWSGDALEHLQAILVRLDSCRHIYRNWCPAEEIVED